MGAATAVSPDGSRLAIHGKEKVALLATDTLERVAEFPVSGPPDRTGNLRFASDGQTLAVAEAPGRITFLRLPDGKRVRSMEVGSDGWAMFATSPDDRTLAVSGVGPATPLWDITTGSRIGELEADGYGYMPSAFTPMTAASSP